MTQPNVPSHTPQPLHRFLLWRVAAVITVSLLIAVLGTIFVLQSFNPNRYAPALVMALEQVTGRQVTLSGLVKIRWSLTPAIQANDIVIANPPGFSTPNLLTLGGLRAEVALLPLFSHRVDILRLVLLSPHLTLERSPGGQADWNLSTPRHPASITSFLDSSFKIALEAVEIRDGLLTIRSGNGHTIGAVHFTKLTGTAESLTAPLHLNAQAQIGTAPFTINGDVGPIARLSGIGTAPWPLDLELAMADATLHLTGTIAHPRDATGYDLTAALNIPALDRLSQVLPGNQPLPPIQNIVATAEFKDRQAPLPAIDNLVITAAQSDLSSFRPGLMLNGLNIHMAALDQPLSVTATGNSDSGAFTLQGQFGAPQTLLSPAWLPPGAPAAGNFPISITAKLGTASAAINGAIATPQNLSGAALAITATIPDLSTLSAAAGIALPAWKNIALQTSLIDPGGEGLYNVAGLDDLTVTMDNAAFGGAATLNLTSPPKLQLSLNFTQANLDALLAAYPAQASTVPTAPPPAPPPVATPAATPAAPSNMPIIPDTALPFGFLSWGDGDIQLSADNVIWNGAAYTGLQANINLAGKVLTISPFTGEIPGGNVTISANLDGSQTPVTEGLTIKAPALALGPLLKALKLPGTAEGNLQLQFSATSNGSTLHQIASNLTGQLGAASVNAELDASLLNRAFGPVLQAAGLPPVSTTPTSVRCFGVLVSATQGEATLKSFGIDTHPLFLQGTGSVDLSQESLNISLQPANGVPIQLGGSFAQPSLTPPPSPAAAPPPQVSMAARPDICPTILAAARLGQTGPAAQPLSTSIAVAPTAVPAATAPPKNLLNSLLMTP